jgi:hypothetical protein
MVNHTQTKRRRSEIREGERERERKPWVSECEGKEEVN